MINQIDIIKNSVKHKNDKIINQKPRKHKNDFLSKINTSKKIPISTISALILTLNNFITGCLMGPAFAQSYTKTALARFEENVSLSAIVRYCKINVQKEVESSSIETEIKKIDLLDRKDLLIPKTTQKSQISTLTVTCTSTLPNVKQTVQNHWTISKTYESLEKTFSIEPIIPFRKKKPEINSL